MVVAAVATQNCRNAMAPGTVDDDEDIALTPTIAMHVIEDG